MSLRQLTAHERKQVPNSKQSLTESLSGSPLLLKIVRLGSMNILRLRDFFPIVPVLGLTGLVNPFRRRRFGRIRNITPDTAEEQDHQRLQMPKTALYIKSETLILMIKKLLQSIWRNLKTNLLIKTESIVL